MKHRFYILLILTVLLSGCCPAIAQNRDKFALHEESWRYQRNVPVEKERIGDKLIALSTNVLSWLNLGTANIEVEGAVSRHITLLCGIKYNPWTFEYGTEHEFRERVLRPYAGARWWVFNHYTGWFAGMNVQGSIHSYANILNNNCLDGWFAGIGVQAGYAIMLSQQWNLTFGAGAAAGYFNHRKFTSPRCGRIIGTEEGITLQPSELMLQLNYIF